MGLKVVGLFFQQELCCNLPYVLIIIILIALS